MNLVNAEVAKIAVNTYVTTKISYANMLSELCERLPGGDVDVVTDAVGRDTRIGPGTFTAATDTAALLPPRQRGVLGSPARGITATLPTPPTGQPPAGFGRLARLWIAILPERWRVSVLGLSYKPEYECRRGSQGVVSRTAAEHRQTGVT